MDALIALSATVLLGYIAQHFGICMVLATRNALKGEPTLLVAVLLSGAWVWLYSIGSFFNNWSLPFERYQLHPMFVVGGFIFGVGASINQGCSISTMNQLAKGHVGKSLTVFGWLVGWLIWTQMLAQGTVNVQYIQKDVLNLTNTLITACAVLILLIIFIVIFKPPIKLMLGVLSIGLISSLLFYLVPNWPPSQLLNDMGNAVFHDKPTPSFLRIGIVVALLVGMWIAAAIHHDTRLRFPRWRSGVRFLAAGTMMGIGGAMALGGNDTQLLFGIPATSPGALSALLFMFIGIACEQFLYQRGVMFYRKNIQKN